MFLGEPTEEELLELRRNNWPEWSKKIRKIFSLCPGGLLGYIDGRISCPDALAWPTEHHIWLDNDAMVRSFCAFRAKGEDLRLIQSATSAFGMWCILKKRHEPQGPSAQLFILLELLNVRFDVSLSLATQGREVVRQCERIMAMGPLSASTLAVGILLYLLGFGFEHIAKAFVHEQSDANSTLTSARIVRRLELEQQIVNGRLSASASATAGPASALAVSSRPFCTNCKATGHWLDRCYQVGGPLYPQRHQIIAKQKRRKALRKVVHNSSRSASSASSSWVATSSSSSVTHRVFHDAQGKAYIFDGESVVPLTP